MINNVNDISRNATVSEQPEDLRYLSAMKNNSLMGSAMVTMEAIMLLFTELANAKFDEMSRKTEVSRDAQDMANRVDAIIAGLEKADSKGSLPEDVIEYMRANNIPVNGMSIDEFLESQPGFVPAAVTEAAQAAKDAEIARIEEQLRYAELNQGGEGILMGMDTYELRSLLDGARNIVVPTSNVALDRADLTSVKSALESTSGRASDFVQQNQLKLQQVMQNFNTAVTMANSVQSMNAESAKSIAQAIR